MRWQAVPIGLWIFLAHEVVVLLGTQVPYAHPSFSYTEHNQSFPHHAHYLFQWDSLWFINIAHHGYAQVPHVPFLVSTAFFPWLPVLIHVFGVIGAWVLTQGAFAVALWRVPRVLTQSGLPSHTAILATWLLAFNPTMVYDAMLYAEPWTILFVVLSIELGLNSRWAWAALTGALAATTQATGIFIGVVPLVIGVMGRLRHDRHRIGGVILWGLGPLFGIATYAVYLGIAFHHPLLFATIQHTPFWNATWEWPWLQWLQAWRASTIHPMFGWLALSMTALFIGGFSLLKAPFQNDYGLALTVYAFLGLLVAASFANMNGPYHSSLRIASIYFPLYAGLARLPMRWFILVLVLFAMLGITGTVLVSHGWWYQ